MKTTPNVLKPSVVSVSTWSQLLEPHLINAYLVCIANDLIILTASMCRTVNAPVLYNDVLIYTVISTLLLQGNIDTRNNYFSLCMCPTCVYPLIYSFCIV